MYSLCNWLPEFMSQLVQGRFIPVLVREYFNAQYGTFTLNLQSPNFSQIRVTIDKGMLLSMEESSPSQVDIITIPCKQFRGVEGKVANIIGKKLNLDLKSRKDWRTQAKNLCHVRIDITITSNYGDADEVLLREVENACVEYVYSFYKGVESGLS